MDNKRDYTYYDHTISLCITCHRRISAKIVFEQGKVYLIKTCKEHGFQKVLIATDVEYYKQIRNYNKASEYPGSRIPKLSSGVRMIAASVLTMSSIVVLH